MSAETLEWLNTFTLQSRAAWHTDKALQALLDSPTVYDGDIPIEEVRKRLFGWKAIEGDLVSNGMAVDNGMPVPFTVVDKDRKTILRPPGALGLKDQGAVMGVFKKGYQVHDYEQWLLNEVAAILDDDLRIYSAGLLRGGAQAWVQVSIPETIKTPEGVEFRPNLAAITSCDGSLATTIKRSAKNIVCDNTMRVALGAVGEVFKVKHSAKSIGQLVKARDALGLIHTIADDFAAEVKALCEVTVTDKEYTEFLNTIAPLEVNGELKKGRGLTIASAKHEEMSQLWNHDDRVSPWKNTAWGVVQAVNTHTHHIQTVRGTERTERNQSMTVTGGFDKLDADTTEQILSIVG